MTRRVKILSTLLAAEKYSQPDLAQLLLSRWNIELDLKNIKRELGMNFLSCKKPEMILKQIWMNLLAFNLVRRLIHLVAKKAGIVPRKISFKKTLDYYLASYQQQRFSLCRIPRAISKFILRKQVDRFEPRARKTSGGYNDYQTLTLTRRKWKLIQIMPYLDDQLDFSSALKEGFQNLKKQIPKKDGKTTY
jgi:hypothetical protein